MNKNNKIQKTQKRGMIIHSQGREIISRVITFMEHEAANMIDIPKDRICERVQLATGISSNLYYKIRKEKIEIEKGVCTKFTSPNNKKCRPFTKTNLDENTESAIRRIIFNYHIKTHEAQTLKKILNKVLESGLNFDCRLSAFRLMINRLGYKWRKTCDYNKKLLIEKYNIRLLRITYLRKIKEYRLGNRPIIYTNITYIHSQSQYSKARLIIAFAGGKHGFVNKSLLLFKSKKSGNHFDDLNFDKFYEWVKIQLIPNLPKKSVLVINNVNTVEHPTNNWKKCDLMKWLNERDIIYDDSLTKLELFNLIKPHISTFNTCKIDQLLAKNGHSVLRLPIYHRDLNPLEKISILVKSWVPKNNVKFHLNDVGHLIEMKISMIGEDIWEEYVDDVLKIEEEYFERELITDSVIEEFDVNVDSDDSGDSDFYIQDDDDGFDS